MVAPPRSIAYIHLFTTSDAAGGRSTMLERLIASLETFRVAHPDVALTLHLLLQRADEDTLVDLPGWVKARALPSRVSLSEARNILMTAAGEQVFTPNALVAFPDDDAWYPSGLLNGIATLFEDATIGFFFCRYRAKPEMWGGGGSRPARLGEVIRAASSNTIFIRGNVVRIVGGFDEELGIGARLNGGEDTDYALRVYSTVGHARFAPRSLVGHRDPAPNLHGHYYAGSLKAIARYAAHHPAGFIPLGRKLVVGVYYVLIGRLTPLSYLRALAARS